MGHLRWEVIFQFLSPPSGTSGAAERDRCADGHDMSRLYARLHLKNSHQEHGFGRQQIRFMGISPWILTVTKISQLFELLKRSMLHWLMIRRQIPGWPTLDCHRTWMNLGTTRIFTMILHHFTSLLGGFKHEILTFPFSWECHHPNWRTPWFFRGVGIPWYTTNQFWYRLPVVFPWETRWIGKTPAFGAKFSRWLWPRLQLSGQAWGFSYTSYKVNYEAINHHEHYYVSTCFNTWWFFETSICMYLYSWWL